MSGPAERPEHQGPGPGRSLHLLLPEQDRLRKAGEGPGKSHGHRVDQLSPSTCPSILSTSFSTNYPQDITAKRCTFVTNFEN